MKYEKPDLEEMELILEGSFLAQQSVGIDKTDKEEDFEDGGY